MPGRRQIDHAGEKPRYVETRKNKDGTFRYVWNRRGHGYARLPDNREKMIERAQFLNDKAEGRITDDGRKNWPAGSIGYCVGLYYDSEDWENVGKSTRKYYKRFISEFEEGFEPNTPLSDLHPEDIADFIWSYENDNVRKARTACSVVYQAAILKSRETGVVGNIALAMKVGAHPKPREAFWFQEHLDAFRDACKKHHKGAAVEACIMLQLYSAQRVVDCLTHPWELIRDGQMMVRQQKTGARFAIRIPQALQQYLDSISGERRGRIVLHDGKPLSYTQYNKAFREIREMAGLGEVWSPDAEAQALTSDFKNYSDLQSRDLRRTAVVRLEMAGCTIKQIASITGHSIEETQRIIDTYLPRTTQQADEAIRKLDEWEESNRSSVTT